MFGTFPGRLKEVRFLKEKKEWEGGHTSCACGSLLPHKFRVRFIHMVTFDNGFASRGNGIAKPAASSSDCVNALCNQTVNKRSDLSTQVACSVTKEFFIYRLSNIPQKGAVPPCTAFYATLPGNCRETH